MCTTQKRIYSPHLRATARVKRHLFSLRIAAAPSSEGKDEFSGGSIARVAEHTGFITTNVKCSDPFGSASHWIKRLCLVGHTATRKCACTKRNVNRFLLCTLMYIHVWKQRIHSLYSPPTTAFLIASRVKSNSSGSNDIQSALTCWPLGSTANVL